MAVGSAFVDGPGQFKFALVNHETPETYYWRNAASTAPDGQPDEAVTLTLTRGLYSVLLGDTTLENMAELDANVFEHTEVYLRIWFDDGIGGFQRLSPDQRIASVGYAFRAASVPDGSITSAKLAPDALGPLSEQIAALTAQVQTLANQCAALSAQVEALAAPNLTAVSAREDDPLLLAKGYTPFHTVPAPSWGSGSRDNAPSPRYAHSAVWTGQEFIVWGGNLSALTTTRTGSRYDPAADQWKLVSTADAPTSRGGHTAVWTGQEMVVWGGYANSQFLADGGRYRPSEQVWSALPEAGAPAGRDRHIAVWTGSRMLVWGGRNDEGLCGDGGLFDPAANAWLPLEVATPPAPRQGATAVWTGTSLVVWGGEGASGYLQSGGELTFNPDGAPSSWRALSTAGAPSPRTGHTAVWTGAVMVIWGGRGAGGLAGDGAAYTPGTDTWTPLTGEGAPSARTEHSALWTGAEMVVVCGRSSTGAVASGAAYNPLTESWRPLSAAGDPQPRSGAAAAWTGTEVLVFGGQNGETPLAALQRLNPQPTWHFYRKP